ncbi:hypothetical protein [Corynebacterium sp. LaCa222]|uniref:hypothetical protein n=1 Tax=Corynebacterium sp. LaCa222 TaxID=3391427 RepID=UPI003989C824
MTESTATSSAEASSPESTAEETTESEKKVDSSGLTMRSAEDFLAKGPEYAQSKAWGVKVPMEKFRAPLKSSPQARGAPCSSQIHP